MTLTKWVLLGALLLLLTPAWADNVYFAAFEDSVNGDYDYNDLVLSLSGEGITLHTTTGAWFPKPVLGSSGSPFWNRGSGDGPNDNVGYCIYGGGNCSGGSLPLVSPDGLAPNDMYLALATNGVDPVGDVTFTVDSNGPISSPVYLKIAGDTNLIGWYSVGDPSVIHWINSPGDQTDLNFSFSPGGAFGLVANNHGGVGGDTYYSQSTVAGTQDPFGSHFAFFGGDPPSSVPEPGSLILFGTALFGFSVLLRRRKRDNQ